ncbi:hypothetical protein PR003_g11696 [Phytophthora rubi]|uniref:Uncharacterized protein n=2 Tax=Phytophthora rubi TaxID=129364 RepID=A0A6A4FAC5_9STRA|nr:hypothetical protein PR001_g11147 [Phytophthora rubi]KAE9338059.1 hypothetical protein PR003_g11696 [Phytophthora rubi]
MPRKAKKTKFEKEAENLAALLSSGNDEDAVLAGQAAFWKDFRARVAENDASIGLEALDLLAMAILQGDESATLSGTVLLLPPPDAMQAGVAPFHALINPDDASPPVSSKRPAPRSAVKPKAPPAKKQRKAPKKVIYSFSLPGSTPAQVKLDLAAIVQVATSRGLAPFRIAYAWVGQRCWYKPKKHPELHLQHYRTWMRHRPLFFACALYASTKNSEERRKLKLLATTARNCFLSSNIEEFGYYGFLELFENGSHDKLMWMGGKAAKHSPGTKDAAGPVPEDLAVLFAMDRSRYDQTQLIDPARKLHLRLSNRALARIKLDVVSRPPPVHYWVGNRSSGPWKALLSDRTLRPIEAHVVRLLIAKKRVAIYNEKKYSPWEQGEDDSDFEDDGKYTALAPTPPLQMPKASDEDSDEGELSHTGLTEDSEASGDENGGATPVESTKAGKKRAGASKPKEGSSHSGRSSGGKPSGSKTSSGKSGGGEAGGGGKAESGEGGGGKKTAPSTSPSGSSTTEEMPPAATVELKSSDTGGAQVSAAAEP